MAKLVRKVVTLQPERIKEIQEIEPNVSAFIRMAVVEKLFRHAADEEKQLENKMQEHLVKLAAMWDELEGRMHAAKDPKERQRAAAALNAVKKNSLLDKDQLMQVEKYQRMFGTSSKGGKRK